MKRWLKWTLISSALVIPAAAWAANAYVHRASCDCPFPCPLRQAHP